MSAVRLSGASKGVVRDGPSAPGYPLPTKREEEYVFRCWWLVAADKATQKRVRIK